MKIHRTKITLLAASIGLILAGCGGGSSKSGGTTTPTFAKPTVYTGFPVTLKGADRGTTAEPTTSVSYKGQMARNVLRESAKAATKADPYVAGLLTKYIKNENKVVDDEVIFAPKTKGTFVIKETIYNELGTGRNLYGKLYDTDNIYRGTETLSDAMPGVSDANKNVTHGMPGAMSAKDVIDFWITKFEELNSGNAGKAINVDLEHGFDYNQLFPKYLMGSLFYYQTSNLYLDEFISQAGLQDNSLPYNSDEAKIYTGKEHSWDEGFGYFGASAHYGLLTGEQNYNIKKQKEAHFAAADKNSDGAVSLYKEYNSGVAYYAALFDKDTASNTTYGKNIMDAFLAGRTVITNAVDANGDARNLTNAERTKIMDYATTVQRNWEMVFAEAAHRYAGISHQKIKALELTPNDETIQKDYYKVWGELKGFMLALQYGGAGSKINLAKYTEISDLIGYGPVLPTGKQVTGITNGDYTLGDASFADYKGKLKDVQAKLDAFYSLKAKLEPIQ